MTRTRTHTAFGDRKQAVRLVNQAIKAGCTTWAEFETWIKTHIIIADAQEVAS